MTEQGISRFEWKFDSCPGEELELCFEYERSRDVPEDIKETERWRETYIKSLNSTVWVGNRIQIPFGLQPRPRPASMLGNLELSGKPNLIGQECSMP